MEVFVFVGLNWEDAPTEQFAVRGVDYKVNIYILTLEYACLSVRPSVRVRDRKTGLTHYPLLLRSWIAANTLSKGWIVC